MTQQEEQEPDEPGKPQRRRWQMAAEPSGKLTGEQLEARFDQWSRGAREKVSARTPQQNGSLTRRVVAGLLIGGFVTMAVSTGMRNDAHQEDVAANDERIHQLQIDLEVAQTPVEPEDVKTEMTNLSTQATTAAQQVADKQQHFAELYRQADTSSSPGNGAPNKAELATAQHRRTLAGLFDKDTFVVEGQAAYQWSTAPDIAPDEVDPRFEWYIRYDGKKASDPKAYQWQVEAAMPSVSQDDRVEVVWVCRQKSGGQVLAWASATYDGTTRVFDDLELVVTTTGQAHGRSAGTQDGGTKVPRLQDLEPKDLKSSSKAGDR